MRVDLSQIESYMDAAKRNAAAVQEAQKILPLIDLTSLNATDTPETIDALCAKAQTEYGAVAAVCVFPLFVNQVKKQLKDSSVKIASVVNFPSGADALERVMEEIHQTIQAGAQEIDVVFPYAMYLQGNKKSAYDFIRACKTVCGKSVKLKVILETGALADLAVIAEVSHNVCLAGADFLKTSTGKISVGATLDAACVMLMTIKELTPKLHHPIGFKVSGGVRTVEQAAEYIALANEIMGEPWVVPDHFRLGASQLLDQVIAKL